MARGQSETSAILYGEHTRRAVKGAPSSWRPQEIDPKKLDYEEYYEDNDGWSGCGLTWTARTSHLPDRWKCEPEERITYGSHDYRTDLQDELQMQPLLIAVSDTCQLLKSEDGEVYAFLTRDSGETYRADRPVNAHQLAAVEQLTSPEGQWRYYSGDVNGNEVTELIYLSDDETLLGSVAI